MGAPPLETRQFVSEVRAYIRDFPELNRLIAGHETSDRLMEYMVWLALDEWNTTPPLSSQTVETFPSRAILLSLTLCHLLTSVGILKSRNRMPYSDGGFSVDTETQDDSYPKWIQLLRSQVNPRILQLKIALNIAGGWGTSVRSEYALIHGWYGGS
mgnify:CR=1 FL=1